MSLPQRSNIQTQISYLHRLKSEIYRLNFTKFSGNFRSKHYPTMFRSLTRGLKIKIGGFPANLAGFCSISGGGSASRKLEGKVAVITGGASGIGKATAGEFVRQGAKVVIADIDDRKGAETAEELGPACSFVQCDVTSEAQVAAAVAAAVSLHRKLDVMFNNVGTVGRRILAAVTDIDMEEFDQVMEVNVRATVVGIKHAAKVMIPAGSGSILCASSVAGRIGGLGPHAYTGSKFAVRGIVKSMANELGRHGVRINCLSPGPIPTHLTIGFFRQIYVGATDEEITEIVNRLGELKGAKCEEDDVAKAAVYLSSDDAKYISGHDLVIDGGFTSFKTLNLPPP